MMLQTLWAILASVSGIVLLVVESEMVISAWEKHEVQDWMYYLVTATEVFTVHLWFHGVVYQMLFDLIVLLLLMAFAAWWSVRRVSSD